MDVLAPIAVITVIGVAAYSALQRLSVPPVRGPVVPTTDPLHLTDLAPGDIIAFWQEGERVVRTVVDCHETINGREVRWRWLFLDGGEVIELAPRGNTLYADVIILWQGSPEFDQITADPGRGGVLAIFEARVRANAIATNPTHFELHGNRYQVLGTGSFLPLQWGRPLVAPVWCDVSPDPAENVYFTLRDASGAPALGIWTSHVLLLRGRPLDDSDTRAIYWRFEERSSA